MTRVLDNAPTNFTTVLCLVTKKCLVSCKKQNDVSENRYALMSDVMM